MLTFRSAERAISEATSVRQSDWTLEVLRDLCPDRVFSQARALVGQGDWSALSCLLDDANTTQFAHRTGPDTNALIVAASLAYLHDLVEQLGPIRGYVEIERVLGRYDDAADAVPDDANLAALAALAHLVVCAAWAHASLPDRAWVEVTHHTRAATSRLEPFDTRSIDSPSLALASSALAAQLETLSDLAWTRDAS